MRASSVFVRLAIVISKYFFTAALAMALPVAAASATTTEVGAIPGSFAVSPTGAATYNIPITVPPGIAGMSPHLALTYNSQSDAGLAGYGWTLSGLSVITVCPRNVVEDKISRAVDFSGTSDSANRFCVDGTRLKATNGTYGTDGSTYRKSIDDFSLFTAHSSGGAGAAPSSGPQYFTMQTPDGLTYEYGATVGSEITAWGPGVPSGVTVVRAWALDKIYDKFGNAVVFNYAHDTNFVDFWPTSIVYTTHNGIAGPNTVAFSYDDLSNVSSGLMRTSYVGGAQVLHRKRLNEIDVNYNGVTTFAYTLTYTDTLNDSTGNNQGTERSLLHTVKECAGSSCYPVTTINWQTGTSGWGAASAASMAGKTLTAAEAAAMMMIDVNGDGMADVVYPQFAGVPAPGTCTLVGDWMVMLAGANGAGPAQPIDTGIPSDCNSPYAMPIDLTNSGLQGWLVPKLISGTVDWYVVTPSIVNGVLSFSRTDTGLPAIGHDNGNATLFDFNGDGLADIVYSDGSDVRWYKNKGDGTFYGQHLIESGVFSSSSDGITQFLSSWGGSAAAFDGTSTGGFMLASVNENNLVPTWSLFQAGDNLDSNGLVITGGPSQFGGFSGTAGDTIVPMFIDLNGDGLSDVLYADTYPAPALNPVDVFLSSGANFSGGGTSVDMNLGFMQDRVIVDYTGNGRQSALFGSLDANSNCVGIGKLGYAQGTLQAVSLGMSGEGPCATGYMKSSFRAADIDGDGLDDLLWVASGVVHYALHKGNLPDLVTSISNGFSQTYSPRYAPLSDGAPYTEGTSPSGDLIVGPGAYQSHLQVERGFIGPMDVVSSYTFKTGLGSATASESFTYSGALINLVGRGFEGFSEVTTYDSRLHGTGDTYGTLVDTTYNQPFPLTGTVATQTRWTNTASPNQGNIASFVTNTYLSAGTQGGAKYVYLGTSVANGYELGAGSDTSATATTTVTTTTTPTISGGAITQLDVSRSTNPASVTSDTKTTFITDTASWCLVLPDTVKVTNTDDATQVSLSRSTSYVEDTGNCRETSESATETDSNQVLTKAFTYDAYGHAATVAVTGAVGSTRTTTYGYDGTNEFVASITNALNETGNQTWNPALGVVLTATDPNGVQASFNYDGFGLKTKETDADGTSVTWCYGLNSGDCGTSISLANAAYWVVPAHYSATNIKGATGTTVYDSFGRPLQSTGNVLGGSQTNVQTVYDSLGRVSATSTPYIITTAEPGPTTWTYTVYDSFDRAAMVYSPAGEGSGCSTIYSGEAACVTQYGYNGLTTSVTDPKGNTTSSTVDAAGRTRSVTDANNGITQYAYDPFGDLTKTIDAAQHETDLVYDSWGRKTDMTDPDMGHWTYAYDAFGELTSQTDAKGQTITMAYDLLGRLVNKKLPGQSIGDTWVYDGPLDANGHVTPTAPYIGKLYSMQSDDGNYSRAYQYDSAGRPTEVDASISQNTYVTNTSYDSFGRVASITYPDEPTPLSDDPPVAVAAVTSDPSGPFYPQVGQAITLDGSQSSDLDNGPQALSYTWAQTSGPPGAQPISGLPATAAVSYFNFSATTAGTYSFTLTTSDSVLTSSAVASVTVYPQPIVGLQGSETSASAGSISLSWTPHSGDGPYNIEQSTNGGAFQTLSGTFGEPASLTGYAEGSYQFAVQSCANGACTDWSAPVSVTMLRTPSLPATPTLGSSNPSTNGQAKINWSAPAGTITFYKVFTKTDSGAYNSGVNVGNVHTFTITGLTSPHNYTFAVAACNTVNGADDCSAKSAGVTVTVNAPGVPWPPTLTGGPHTVALQGTASFSWSNNGGTVTSWTLQRTDTNNGTVTTAYTGTATTFSQVLTKATTFEYEVKACNGSGCSGWSNSVFVVVGNGGNLMTPAPTSATGAGSASIISPAPGLQPTAPMQAVLAPTAGRPGVRSRVQAARDLALRLKRRNIVRAEHRRQQRLAASDQVFDPRPRHGVLYAAEMEGQGVPAGQLFSAQEAMTAGMPLPTGLAPHRLMVDTTSRFSVNYVYDANENLTQVVNAANPDIIYWEGTASDAFGHITTDILGNGIVTTRAYDPNTGMIQQETSGVGSGTGVADRTYTWDADGNLNTRTDNVHGLTETFGYDNLNRIKTAVVGDGTASSLSMSYDAIGNITSKTNPGTGADMGAYVYDPNHPMQISTITQGSTVRHFQYDNSSGAGNGNLVDDGLRTYTWDAENRPILITVENGGPSTSFKYSPDGQRYYESTTGSDPTTLTEVNGLFQVYAEGGHTSYRNSIAAPTGIVAIYTVQDSHLVTTRYLTTDHLGSSAEITNETGGVEESESYDVFGAKRDPTTWQTYAFGAAPGSTDITDKGYTGQQQLDALGLIHMNGRVQDPYTGRFVSADPTVPDPFYSQSFNRFAYVYNNPMNAVDPSGFGPQQSWKPKSSPSGWLCDKQGYCYDVIDPYGVTAQAQPNTSGSSQQEHTVNLGKVEVTGHREGRNQPGFDDGTVGPNKECISGFCQGPDPDNNPRNKMDSTDGATTWNGTFSNNDANPPIGFLGQIPIPARQLKMLMRLGISGGGGPKAPVAQPTWSTTGLILSSVGTLVEAGDLLAGSLEKLLPRVPGLRNSSLTRVGEHAAPILEPLNAGIHLYDLNNHWDNPDLNHPVVSTLRVMHDTLNLEMDYVGARGGVYGFITSGIYTGVNWIGEALYEPLSDAYEDYEQIKNASAGQQQFSDSLVPGH